MDFENGNNHQQNIVYLKRKWFVKEHVVISGISGRYPKSDNVEQFKENLFNKVDMITDANDRYPAGKNGFPFNCGKVENLNLFDGEFFNKSDEEANWMDPQLRKLLEVSFECLIDAGLSLEDIKGTNTGFYWGSAFQETDSSHDEYCPPYRNQYNTVLSNFYDIKGPISQYDTACGSSFCALNEAFVAIKSGVCDQAFVAGYNISLSPGVTLKFQDLKMSSMDGRCKSLDESANGYGRSEAVCCILLQKKTQAKRIYSTIVNSRSNTDGYKEEGLVFPSVDRQRKLMLETFDEVGLDPIDVNYIEAHLTGTQAGDVVETKAIYDVFCPQRSSQNPFLVGSSKSNMGHSEAASGLCGLTKALIIFQTGFIPPNINYKKPNPKIQGLMDGKLKPVLDIVPLVGSYISLNCFGFGGTNIHVILKGYPKKSSSSDYQIANNIPRLITIANRTHEGVLHIQKYLEKNIDLLTNQFLDLLNTMSITAASKMPCKGYTIIYKDNNQYIFDNFTHMEANDYHETILYLPSHLIQFDVRFKHIPVFCDTLSSISVEVKAYDINLDDIIYGCSFLPVFSTMKEMFVKLICRHILIINMIKAINIPVFDLREGYLSKISLAYKNSEISEKEAIYIAYWLGHFLDGKRISKITNNHAIGTISNGQIDGSKQCLKNGLSEDNLIITIKKYAQKKAKNLDTKQEEVIIEQHLSILSSSKDLPKKCLIIDFTKKSSTKSSAKIVKFFDNLSMDVLQVEKFLQSIGQIYCSNIPCDISCLYPKVNYPIPLDTLSLNSLIRWNHSKSHKVIKYPEFYTMFDGGQSSSYFKINIGNTEDCFYSDHQIDERILFPATGLLAFAWHCSAKLHRIPIHYSKVRFEDVAFVRATVLAEKATIFTVQYMPYNGSFLIVESGSIIAEGKVFLEKDLTDKIDNYVVPKIHLDQESCLSREDIYKELRIRGYDYGPNFKCLKQADPYGSCGYVEWKEIKDTKLKATNHDSDSNMSNEFMNTWITFSDSVLQLALLANRNDRHLYLPTGIQSLLVDPSIILDKINTLNRQHIDLQSVKEDTEIGENHLDFKVDYDLITKTLVTDGMWIRGLKASLASRRPQKVLMETYDYVPYFEDNLLDDKVKQKLLDYQLICSKLSHALQIKAANGEQIVDEIKQIKSIKQEYDYENNSSYSLMKYLIESLTKTESANGTALKEDILVGQELHLCEYSRFFSPIINIALKQQTYSGSTNSTIAVLEYNESKSLLFENVKKIIDNQSIGTLKLSYTLATSESNVESVKNLTGQVNHIVWDAKSTFPGDVVQSNMLIYKNYTSNLTDLMEKMDYLLTSIQSNGFFVIIFRENISTTSSIKSAVKLSNLKDSCIDSNKLISYLNERNWICVAKKILDLTLLPINGLVFKKKLQIYDKPIIIPVKVNSYEWIDNIKSALNSENKTSPILLIADSNNDNGLIGFTKSLCLEAGGERIQCLLNRYANDGLDLSNIDDDSEVVKHVIEKGLKFNVYDSSNGWGDYCHLEDEENIDTSLASRKEVKDVQLRCLLPGDLTSLVWSDLILTEDELKTANTVAYASLNFKDVMLANGKLPVLLDYNKDKENSSLVDIGIEYSGYDSNGKRVMGMVEYGSMSTKILFGKSYYLWPVPDNWTMEEAASVPVVYVTAIYALIVRANLQAGESVLIHAGSGGVGIAAITLCLAKGCEVFTTVGSKEKREFLFKQFPQLKANNVGNSRDTSFEEMVMRETNGRGVDIVLNCLADDKLQASIRCLAVNGRFCEIGKYDAYKNTQVNLGLLDNGRSFHGVLNDLLGIDSKIEGSAAYYDRLRLIKMLQEYIDEGIIFPLPRNVFSMGKVEDAFRFMASGKHIGKVLIKISDSNNNSHNDNISESIKFHQATQFSANKSYLIVGGFGGLGLELALWLASKGARNIILNSRNGPKTSYHHYCLSRLKETAVNVIISKHDLISEQACLELINSLSVPLAGVFNSALVLRDNLINDQTPETFAQVCQPKINVTANLDKLTRQLCPQLDYFVTFSSVTSGRGNIGQTNYALANSFMESVCERRRKDKLHGLAIQWGIIGDVGVVFEKFGSDIQSIRSTAAQRPHSCFALLDKVLSYSNGIVSSVVRAEDMKAFAESSGDIVKSISHMLGIKDIHSLDPKITLGELGMDSLIAIELQQALERNFSMSITTKDIRSMNIGDLLILSKKLSSSQVTGKTLVNEKNDNQDMIAFVVDLPSDKTIKLNDSVDDEIIFVLPPIEGHYKAFGDLPKNIINAQLIGLNWTYDLAGYTNFEQVASYFADIIIRMSNNSEKIKLIAYSFGGLLALSIAYELNRRQTSVFVDKLVLLDCKVQQMKDVGFGWKASIKNEQVQRELIKETMKRYIKDFDDNFLHEEILQTKLKLERFDVIKKVLIAHKIDESEADKICKINELTLQKAELAAGFEYRFLDNCDIIHLRADKNLHLNENSDQKLKIGKEYFFDGHHQDFIVKNINDITKIIIDFLL